MSDKTIIRVQKNKNFSVISNVHLNDKFLSWKAKGILTYLLSKPDDWQLYIRYLVKQSKDGRDSTYAGIQELIKTGYIIKNEKRDENGIIRGIEYIVIENPPLNESVIQNPMVKKSDYVSNDSVTEKQLSQNPDTAFPDTAFPDTENPLLPNTDPNQIQKTTTTDRQRGGRSLSQSFLWDSDNQPVIPESKPIIQGVDNKPVNQVISRPDNQDLKKPDNPVINRPADKDVEIQHNKTASQNTESKPAVNADDFKKEHDALINMIPEPMRKPVIVSLVDRYHKSHGMEHTADAILYTNGRPKKEDNQNWQSYRGHLSKGLAGHYEGIAGIYRTVLEKEREEENIRIKKAEAEKRRDEEQRKKAELKKDMEAFSRMKEALFWSRFHALPEEERRRLTEKFLIIKEKNIIIQRFYMEQGIEGRSVRGAFQTVNEAALLSEQERSFEHFTADRQAPVMPAVIN